MLDDPSRKVIDKVIRVSAWGDTLRILPGSERTENHNHPDPGSKTLFRLAGALAKVDPAPGTGAGRLPAVAGSAHPQRAHRR